MRLLRNNSKIAVIISLAIGVGMAGILLMVFTPKLEQQMHFGEGFSELEKQKIQTDLLFERREQFEAGFSMRIEKYITPDCTETDEVKCVHYLVDYIYNKYGDNVPGYLEMEEGIYRYRSSL